MPTRVVVEAATAEIKGIEQFAIRSFQPELTILLDLATEIGLSKGKRGELDRFESETAEFFEQVRSTSCLGPHSFPIGFESLMQGAA